MAELKRPASGRVIGGVCAALANRFGWNVTVVRLLAVLSILLPGPQVIAYIVAWIVIPAEQRTATTA
jgi:phage shock protein PspC (stress-responsive transcriptional regulator)